MRALSRIMLLMVVASALLGLTACKAESVLGSQKKAPINISLGEQPNFIMAKYHIYDHFIVVKSLDDKITIKKIVVNRGNCKIIGNYTFPVDIKFGEAPEYLYDPACSVSEVTVSTDKGNWTSSFN